MPEAARLTAWTNPNPPPQTLFGEAVAAGFRLTPFARLLESRMRTERMSPGIALACLAVAALLVVLGVDRVSWGGPETIPLAIWFIINSITWSLTGWSVWKNRKPLVVTAISLDMVAFISGYCIIASYR